MSTGRLKRKLGDLGIDPSSQRANESFCLIGTPLPPLEKSRDNGEFVPVWKQDVRDEQGRRRLHGAFTGGFSAGYYNSVGSKEGWTPQSFVSSRDNKAKTKAARPEDFMDAEDLAEIRDSQSLMDTTEEMDLGQSSKASAPDAEQDSIAAALQNSMAPPPSDSVGARILKKMGWKVGQGIGPRLTWTQRKAQDARLDPASKQCPLEDDIEASKHTYAPRDTPLLLVDRKDNSHGLGYTPGLGLNASLGNKPGTSANGPNLSSGFGLGALNDAEDDDIDVYDRGGTQHRTHMAYDASDKEEDVRITIGGKQASQKAKAAPNPSGTQTFHDGRIVLADFVLSEQPVAEDRWFPLPDIPKGWKPDPTRVWAKGKENHSQRPTSLPDRNRISADQRGSILGETPLPSAPRSVFEYMSQKDRERIQNIVPGAGVPSTSSTPSQPYVPTPAPQSIVIPHMEAQVAQAALRGFRPFAADPVKQSRYDAYLNSQTSFESATAPPAQLAHQKINEYNKELEDYAKAALLFKPISGAMAGRFTSASIVENGPKVIEGLHTPTAADAREKERLEEERAQEEREQEEDSPKANAARMGMFGYMTREVKVWKPVRLLCKRFGVKDPHPEPDVEDMPPPPLPTDQQPEVASGLGGGIPVGADASFAPKPKAKGERKDVMNVGLGEDDEQGKDTLTYERPAMDIFKAIFASDDEDSDDEDAPPSSQQLAILPAPAVAAVPTPLPLAPTLTIVSTLAAGMEVDGMTFKPTFIPRDAKAKKDKTDDKKKPSKKSKSKPIMSFADDEDDGSGYAPARPKDKDRPKKKKKRDDKVEEEADDGMWVEKPAAVVSSGDVVMVDPPPDNQGGSKRKRAADFM